MSLVRTALRLCTVKALSGATAAGDRVRDSSFATLESAVVDNPQPVIVVYTDTDNLTFTGLDLLTATGGTKTLVLLLAVTSARRDGEDVEFVYSATDADTEWQVDMLERQVFTALLDPRRSNPWADLWRRFVVTAPRVRSDRGGSVERGVRFAARQLVFDLDTLSEPVPGQPTTTSDDGIWHDFLGAMSADPDPDFAAMAPAFVSAIVGTPFTKRQRDQMSLGLTWAGRVPLGHDVPGLDIADEDKEPAVLEEADIDATLSQRAPV